MGNDTLKNLKDFYSKMKNPGVLAKHQFQLFVPRAPDLTIYAAGGTLPGKTIETTSAHFFGYEFKIPMSTKYTQNWSTQVKYDASSNTRDIFERWMNSISDISNNTGGSKGRIPGQDYVLIYLLSPKSFNEGSIVPQRTYRLEGAYPSKLGDVAFDHQSNDIATFDVEFNFQYWYNTDQADPMG